MNLCDRPLALPNHGAVAQFPAPRHIVPPPEHFSDDPLVDVSTEWPTVRYTGDKRTRLSQSFGPELMRQNFIGYPYDFRTKAGIDHAVNDMIQSYVQQNPDAGLKIRHDEDSYAPPRTSVRGGDNANTVEIYNAEDHPRIMTTDDLQQNSWVSAYRFDSTTGRLDIEIKTAEFDIQNIDVTTLENFDHLGFNRQYPREDRRAELRKKIRTNLVIKIKTRAQPIRGIQKNEEIAIETLREMITEQEFRRYVKHGFIMVAGQNDRFYQVFRNNPHTKVWYKGKVIEQVCVRIQDRNIPATDNVIAFKTMIETDEAEFKKLGNVYPMRVAA